MATLYHAQYFAQECTRQGVMGMQRLSRSLFDACVDLIQRVKEKLDL